MERQDTRRTLRADPGYDAAGESQYVGRQNVYGHPRVHSPVQRHSARKSGTRARDGEGDRVRTETLRGRRPVITIKEKAMSSNPNGPNPVSRRRFLKNTVAKG